MSKGTSTDCRRCLVFHPRPQQTASLWTRHNQTYSVALPEGDGEICSSASLSRLTSYRDFVLKVHLKIQYFDKLSISIVFSDVPSRHITFQKILNEQYPSEISLRVSYWPRFVFAANRKPCSSLPRSRYKKLDELLPKRLRLLRESHIEIKWSKSGFEARNAIFALV